MKSNDSKNVAHKLNDIEIKRTTLLFVFNISIHSWRYKMVKYDWLYTANSFKFIFAIRLMVGFGFGDQSQTFQTFLCLFILLAVTHLIETQQQYCVRILN